MIPVYFETYAIAMLTCFLHTAGPQTRIALYRNDEVIADRAWPSERRESETLQPAIDAMLREGGVTAQEVDRLVVCLGPGGFTSTRVGVSAANAWAFAAGIPLAGVSFFDLYPHDLVVVIAANPEEAWVAKPDHDPQWVHLDQLDLPERFSFTGLPDESWKVALESRGGTWIEQSEQLPDIRGLEFREKPLQPWYYKDPNITWSDKNRP